VAASPPAREFDSVEPGYSTAPWEAWEALRLDGGTAMGTWWRDHCGPQLGVLMNGEEGPLHLCKPDQHGGIPAPLKSTPTPPEWWGPPRT